MRAKVIPAAADDYSTNEILRETVNVLLRAREPGKKPLQAEMAQRIIGLQFSALNHRSSAHQS
jgi:hypothetical protein